MYGIKYYTEDFFRAEIVSLKNHLSFVFKFDTPTTIILYGDRKDEVQTFTITSIVIITVLPVFKSSNSNIIIIYLH